jgi:Regulator of chromosome condensation (RCC1) repeat
VKLRHLGWWLVTATAAALLAALPAGAAGPYGRVLAWGSCSGALCPVPVAAATGVTAVAQGPFQSLALKGSGGVVAWGCSSGVDAGQCVVPGAATSGVKAIAAGQFHSLALKQDGSVVAWGCGTYSFANVGQCTVPAAAASGVTAISASDWQSLALKQDGTIVAWGCGSQDYGQCTVPAAASSGIVAVAAGGNHSLALRSDGSVVAWGCGRGIDFGNCDVPAAAASGVIAISGGAFHDLGLKQDGSVVAWGCRDFPFFGTTFIGDYGQCAVPAAASSGVVAVAAGAYHSLALKQDGTVVAWGCANGGSQCDVPAEAQTGITAIAASFFQSLAISPALDPAAVLDSLAGEVAAAGPGSSLAQIVQQAQRQLAAGAVASVCGLMNSFDAEACAQTGKTLTIPQAYGLLAEATKVEAALGC